MVSIIRNKKDDKETLGNLTATKDGGEGFKCFTLERPDKNNAPEISCIPEAIYHCVYTNSPHLSKLAGHPVSTYEIQNVPNRAGIRIHSASFFSDLEGCVACGYSRADINNDGELDLTQSRNAIHDFEKFMNYEPFDLKITYQPEIVA